MAQKTKKPSLGEQVSRLQDELRASTQNQTLLEETLAVLETQIYEQGWISIFGGEGKELSKRALNTLYDLGRVYWLKNPLIHRAVEVQALYVFAQGMTIKGDHPVVDEVIRQFMIDRKNVAALTSHQAFMQNETDLRLSGNLFLAFFTNPDNGRVTVRSVPLYEIGDIITNPEDRMEPWFYRRDYMINQFDPMSGVTTPKVSTVYHPDWQYNPKDEARIETIGTAKVFWDVPIYHVKTNCLPDMKFGVSEVYSAIDWAQAYKKFLENWSKLVDAYARFAFSLTTKGGARAVSAAKAKIESVFAKQDPNLEMSDSSTYTQRPVASTFTASEGVKLDTIRTQGATTAADDARRLLLMVSSSSGIPEQILAGDPSTGNLATAKAMERPLELQFRNRQQLWRDIWHNILTYVIDQSIRAENGSLKGEGETDELTGEVQYVLRMQDDKGTDIPRTVSVKFPPLLEHDVLQSIQAIVSGATLDGKPMAGTMDLQTVAQQVMKALNIENQDAILERIFPKDGDQKPILQTDDQMVRLIALLIQAAGLDPWAITSPEQVQSLVRFLQEKNPTPQIGGGEKI